MGLNLSKDEKEKVDTYMRKLAKTATKSKMSNAFYFENGNLIFRTQKKHKAYSKNRILTINYHGSKRAWYKEFEILYNYLKDNYGTTKLIDCFGGSGFLSLLGAQTGLFTEIHLNEIDGLTINYHYVMKDPELFSKFLYYLPSLNKYNFDKLKESYKSYEFNEVKEEIELKNKKKKTISVYVPKPMRVRTPNVKRACYLFSMKHYAYRGSGDFVDKRKFPKLYEEPLKRTHMLYKNIELSKLYYKQVMNEYINDSSALIMLDCPYYSKTRVHKNSYVYEMTERQHRYLLEELTIKNVAIKAKIILCGYVSALYDGYFMRANKRGQSWHCVKILKLGRRKNNPTYEHIWVNFEIDDLVNKNTKLFEKIY